MSNPQKRLQPGRVRDAIINTVKQAQRPLSVKEIVESVRQTLGDVPTSSIRSYLRLNTPDVFVRESRGYYSCSFVQPELIDSFESVPSKVDLLTSKKVGGNAILYHADCFDWLARQSPNSIHAIVTDPPYGLFEYSEKQITKLRSGRGGVWRIPPSFDGHMRSPLPRFTVLSADQLQDLRTFFTEWGRTLLPRLVPGANVIVASNPLLSYIVSDALASAGLERRRDSQINNDHARETVRRLLRGVLLCQRHAAFHVGTLACLSQTCRRACSRQLYVNGALGFPSP